MIVNHFGILGYILFGVIMVVVVVAVYHGGDFLDGLKKSGSRLLGEEKDCE